MKCEKGTKATTDIDKTEFEKTWLEGMGKPEVTQALLFLPAASGGGSASSSTPGGPSIKDLQNRIKQMEESNKRRKLENTGAGKNSGNNINNGGNSKGKGKGKRRRGTSGPAEFGNLPTTTRDGARICFAYNLSTGCPKAKPGEDCDRGRHVCPACFGTHPLQSCLNRR